MDEQEIRAVALQAAARLMVGGHLNGAGKLMPASPNDVVAMAVEFERYVAVGVGAPVAQRPAVPIEESVQPSYLVCLEDGAKLKMLSRHLKGMGMTPEQYRAKWGLPKNYPMTAPDYSVRRTEIAKENGLGVNSKGRPARSSTADLL